MVLLPLRNSPASRFNVRRAANCLPPRAEFAWRASTPLILLRLDARKRWCRLRRARRAQNPGRNRCATPGRFSSPSWESLSVLPSSSKDSGGSRRLSWQWGEHRPLPVYGCFSMRSGSAFPGRCGGAWARCCCPSSFSPGTWRAEESPDHPCRLWKRRWGQSLGFCFLRCLYLSWPV